MRDAAATGLVGFKSHLRVEVVPGEAVYLLSELGVKALHGEHIEALAPLLDGTRTLPELFRDAQGPVPVAIAGQILGKLAQAGLIRYHGPEGPAAADNAALAYWDLLGLDAAVASREVLRKRVRIISVGGRLDPGPVRDACLESGLTVCEGDAPDSLSLVLCEDYLAQDLRAVDAEHRAAGRPWLLAKPSGTTAWVGPVFSGGDGPCWSCLAHRVRAHRVTEVPAQRARGGSGPMSRPTASLGAVRAIGLQLAVLEAAKWLAGAPSDSRHSICTLDTTDLRTGTHLVSRRPQCPDCGDAALVSTQVHRPLTIESRPKSTVAGGGHRALPPDEMLNRYRHLISPVTGIVDAIRRDDRLPQGLNSYVSGRNLALRGRSLAEVRGGLRSVSGGKGVNATEAQVGALCEAVERYCATRQGDEPVVWDTFKNLGSRAIHPNDCQLYSAEQFRNRERWNAGHSTAHHVCEPFDENRPVEWTPVWSLTAGVHRLLPTSMLYFDPDLKTSSGGPWADSNGNAAGSSIEDATVQGFLELVERDAASMWWYNRTRHPAVDLDAFEEPWVKEMRAAYARMHRELWVLDITSDFDIPVMVAISRRIDKPTEDIAFGFGAHFDPSIAFRRAVTELTQLLPLAAQATREGGYATSDPELLSWWTKSTVANQPYLRPDPATPARTPRDFDYTPRSDLREDVEACKALVLAHGMELFVLDQTRPDVALPVVKVIVPGMRHFRARLAPGRLFDVPVTQGHLNAPRLYGELNPIPLFV